MKFNIKTILFALLRWSGGLLILFLGFSDLILAFEKQSMSFSEPDAVNEKLMISYSNALLRIGVMELFLGVLWLYSFRPGKG